MKLRVHSFIGRTAVEGPGERACIWVQGCPIRCAGCFNPETWPFEGGSEMTVDDLFERVSRENDIEGITFLGGEPFAQAAPLAELAERLREKGLSVVTFTGYTLERIRAAGDAAWDRLLAATDLLIDGPFVEAQADQSRPWVGSSNKRFVFLTGRYRHLEAVLNQIPNGLELRISPVGGVTINGMETSEALEEIRKTLVTSRR
ncbi:MAG TPA: 4Fe-4S single cluster domain-containing protein [Candidatus Ozemobacteraceae bacterium]|nr:4Fe-4S single cluster domain-containing protein [Candidatus Ozemobacteraceae bacterium]